MPTQLLKKMNRLLALAAITLLFILFWKFVQPKEAGVIQEKIKKEISSSIPTPKDSYEISPEPPIVFDEKLFSKPIFKSQTPNLRSSPLPFPMGSRGLIAPGSFPAGSAAAFGSLGTGSAVEQLRYIGILPGEPPQVVLEDGTKHKTYYLSLGQSEDGIAVEDIGAETVTVSYGSSTKQFPR